MNFTFACVLRSGGVFSPEWVERLCRDARAHLEPSRVVCLTDFDTECGPPIEAIPLVHDWPGWHSKIELFRPGLFEGPVFYADLDSLILKPIPDLVETIAGMHIAARSSLALLSDFFTPTRPASGVMAWIPCAETEAIYHEFVKRPVCKPGWQNGDGAHIGQFPNLRLQIMFPGVFGSLKADKLDAGPKGFAHVSCHGKPKMCDLPLSHWMHKAWRGDSFA